MKFGLTLNDYISNHVDSKLFTYDEINIISEFIKSYCMDSLLSRMYGDDFEGLKDNQPMREYEMDVIIDVLSERFDRFINGNEEITWKIFRFYYPKDSPRLWIEETSVKEKYEDCFRLFTSDISQAVHLYILDNLKDDCITERNMMSDIEKKNCTNC